MKLLKENQKQKKESILTSNGQVKNLTKIYQEIIFLLCNFLKIRISGFIRPPLKDKYKFSIITTAAVHMTINGATVIKHFSTNYKKGWNEAKYGEKVQSEELQMEAGTMYEFSIKFWRSDH